MRIAYLPAALVFLAIAGCSQAYDPDSGVRSTASGESGLPACDARQGLGDDGFPIIVDTLRRNGEFARANALFGMLRRATETRLAAADPEAPKRLRPALDALFSGAEAEKFAACDFANFTSAQPVFESWEAWSQDAKMREIHAAILDAGMRGVPEASTDLPESRRALLQRIANATRLRDYQFGLASLFMNVLAAVDAAADPASSMQQDLALNRAAVPVPSEAQTFDMLAAALSSFSDGELQRFLAFAETQEGHAYYKTLIERFQIGGRNWIARIPDALRPGMTAPAQARDPAAAEKLLAEATRLYDQVGTRVALPEARTLALRAERLDPQNPSIQVLLGRITLTLSDPQWPLDDGEIRQKIDAMHPAEPARYAAARKYLRRALELDPKRADAWMHLGRIEFELSNDDEAARMYAESRRLDPDGRGLAFNEADLAYVRGDYAKAERIHRKLLAAPERRAFDHYYSLGRLRIALLKQGREREFRAFAREQVKREPDLWDFRLDQARRLLSDPEASIDEIAAMLDPVPDRWLPAQKQSLEASLQLLRAGQAAPAARKAAVQRAFAMVDEPFSVVEATCRSRARAQVFAEVVDASGQRRRAVDSLLACGIWSQDAAFVGRLLPLVADIDAPNIAMESMRPVCMAMNAMHPPTFEAVLTARPNLALRCGDGTTAREFLEERANRTDSDEASRAQARRMLAVLDRYAPKS